MPEIPLEVINIAGSAGLTNGIVSGKIEGDIKAGLTLTGEICHGVQAGLDGEVAGQIGGNATLLFVGSKAQGQLSAAAGAKILVRVEPNIFDKLGLVVEAGAYAYAAAAGSLAVYLTPQHFASYIQDNLDDFTADLFLIFLEEVEAEIGVWGKVAVAAMVEGHVNIILDVQDLDSGFEISAGYNIGLECGGGWDFYCRAGFKNLRRAVNRSTLRVNEEVIRHIAKSDIPNASMLAMAFDFSFPLIVLTAYDIGNESYKKKALVQPADIAAIVTNNFVANLQRFAIEQISKAAVRRLTREFSKLYYQLAGLNLSEDDISNLEQEVNGLIETLNKGDFRINDINDIVTRTVNIVDLLDTGLIESLKQPIAIFWLSSMLGLQVKELLAQFFAEIGVGSTPLGRAEVEAAYDLLPNAPQLVINEVRVVLGDDVLAMDVTNAVDYLIEVGITPLLDQFSPEFTGFRDNLSTAFNITEGDVIEDVLNIFAGRGSLAELNSYGSIKQFVKIELLEGLLINELLPQLKAQSDITEIAEYLDEVVEPSIHTVAGFLFSKLDAILIDDLHDLNQGELLTMMDSLSAGCGVVVYQVLARNIVFFDDVVSDFVLDNAYQGFRTLRQNFENTNHPLFISCQGLFQQGLPGNPDISAHTEALQILLYDMAAVFEHVYGPTIHTPQRRQKIQALKRDILLSIGGKYDYTQTSMPESAIEEMVNCLHIPKLQAVKELGGILIQISIETFLVFVQRIAPSIGDFYLKITLQQFTTLRTTLNQHIDGLWLLANDAIIAYQELTDYIRENITEVLESIQLFVGQKRQILENHLEGEWPALAKSAIKSRGEQIVRDNAPDGLAEAIAVETFHNVHWLVIDPVIDAAYVILNQSLDSIFDDIEGIIENSTNYISDFLAWQENVETQLIADLQAMIVIPEEDTARIIIDVLFPEMVIDQVEQYLSARAEEKTLQVEEHEQEAQLLLLKAEKEEKKRNHNLIVHRPDLSFEILNPQNDFEFIYPASVKLFLVMKNGAAEFLNNPDARRVQLMLNSKALNIESQGWRFNEQSDHYEFLKSFESSYLVDGLNVLELSWITGQDEQNTHRQTISFLVDESIYYGDDDLTASILYDPPGSDVDHEYAQINWNGDNILDLTNWRMLDRVGHAYTLPELSLRQGQSLKIYTGGNSANNQTDFDLPLKRIYMGRGKAIWNNEGDTMYLVDVNNVLAYRYSYGSQ